MVLNFFRGLWAGLVGSSLLSVALMIAAAGIAVAVVAFSPTLTVSALNVYPGISAVDDYAYVYMRAVSEQQDKRSTPAVYVLGASTMREALSSEQGMADRLSDKLGQPVRVVDLATSAQPLWLGDDVAEAAICGDTNAVVLLAASMRRARAYSPTDKIAEINWPTLKPQPPLVALKARAEFLNSVLIEEVPSSLVLSFRRLVATLAGSKPPQRILYSYADGRHRYLNHTYSEKRVLKAVRAYQQYLESDDPEAVVGFFAEIEKLAERLRSCSGLEIVLVDTPLNPAIAESEPARVKLDAYADFLAEFARSHGMHFVNLRTDVSYTMSDFIDGGHLRKRAAMTRTTDRLADVVADVLLAKNGDVQ